MATVASMSPYAWAELRILEDWKRLNRSTKRLSAAGCTLSLPQSGWFLDPGPARSPAKSSSIAFAVAPKREVRAVAMPGPHQLRATGPSLQKRHWAEHSAAFTITGAQTPRTKPMS